MPLTRISIDVTDSSLLPLLFLRSVSIFCVSHIINICGGHIYLIYLSYEYGIFSNISDIDVCDNGYRQILFCLCVRNILITKIMGFGCMLAPG